MKSIFTVAGSIDKERFVEAQVSKNCDERQKKKEREGGRRESQKGKKEKRKSIKWALSISIVDCCECKRKGEMEK